MNRGGEDKPSAGRRVIVKLNWLTGMFVGLAGVIALAGSVMTVGPFQTGPGNRTVISTIAGGGLGVSVPVLKAPMTQPVAVVLDPKGRGYYVLDERDGAG
ncbi:MAG: hypothetical protein ACKOB4_16760, partial [Acidobacteriota bacterium]